ncbi:BgTH12-02574 [Blumeria graminis f. sp. triticale]|uniref:BgTH12-02574 n=1 Tax=Blumeria graminis f. sp. triticale TaxID=1689686 RepID=A0A9W4D1H8_BLUGR|nr:BgTH12-02574 [Blumeria graminis f. sp. triticale]
MTQPVDIHLQDTLRPVQVPAPFTRWGMDHTGPVRHNSLAAYLCTAIDHATSYAMVILTQSPNTASCLELTRQIYTLFGIKQLVTDNGQAFVSKEMSAFCRDKSIEQSLTKPYRPQTNGKVERFNGTIKSIFYAVSSINPSRSIQWILDQSLSTYNRRPNSTGYAPIFLALGVTHEEPPSPYVRELTPSEESSFAADLVKLYNPRVQNARMNVATGKASRDEIRSYLQERKARLRVFGKGDWVLRQRKRDHKGEPFYDGPFIVGDATPQNGYLLRTPGGFTLQNEYHGQQLFPAYVRDGHPVRSLWYGSKTLLDRDRRKMLDALTPWDHADNV